MLSNIFIIIGILILVGFVGRIAYKWTKIPESIFLILIGLLIGPLLNIVKSDIFLPIVPFFSILALLVVLLDSGFSFNIFQVFKRFPKAFMFTIIISVLTTSIIGSMLFFFFEWELLHALLLGLIASGTTTVTAMALLSRLLINKKTKELLFLETVINDFTLIFGASIIILIIKKQQISVEIFTSTISSISIGFFLGIIFGFLWVRLLKKIESRKLNYISTLGVLFLLYGITQSLKGEGLIAALIFSLIIGNYPIIYKKFRTRKRIDFPPTFIFRSIRSVKEDISFLVKVFFFVLIGVIFDLKAVSNNLSTITLIVSGILIFILLSRFISTKILCLLDKSFKPYSFVIMTMLPRGFIATVLAFIPYREDIIIPSLTEIVLLLVLVTNIFAIISGFYYSKFIEPKIDHGLLPLESFEKKISKQIIKTKKEKRGGREKRKKTKTS